MSDIAHERAQAVECVDQAVGHMMRAAVCLDSAIQHVRRGELATEGCRLTLAGTIAMLRDHIGFDETEREFLQALATEALARGGGSTA